MVSFFGPCAPRIMMRSMSPVRQGAGDEGGEAGPCGAVALLDELVACGEIGEKLVAASEDDVVLRQHAEGAAATSAGGEEDPSGLGDEGVALGDAGVAGFIPLGSVEERLAAVAEFVSGYQFDGRGPPRRLMQIPACGMMRSTKHGMTRVSCVERWSDGVMKGCYHGFNTPLLPHSTSACLRWSKSEHRRRGEG